MTTLVRSALIFGLVLPVALTAQANGTGRTGAPEVVPRELSSKKIQRFDPVRVLLDHRKDLKLDDTQREGLDKLENQVQWNLRRLTARIDTAQKRARPDGGFVNDARDLSRNRSGGGRRGADISGQVVDEVNESIEARRERIARARTTIVETVDELQVEFDSTGARAVRGLGEPQRAAAIAVLQAERTSLWKMLRDAGFVPRPE